MFLREQMQTNSQEQIAYMVTLVHDEYLEEVQYGYEPGNFDSWLAFIGQLAVQMSVPQPRVA